MWELQLEGKSVESLSTLVSKLELVGVLVELENLEDLSDNVEISSCLTGLLEVSGSISSGIGAGEEVVGPLSEGGEDGNILSFDGGFLSRESVWCIGSLVVSEWGLLIGGEEGV